MFVIKLLILAIIMFGFFAVQTSRVFEIVGIQPNFIMVAFLVLVGAISYSKENFLFVTILELIFFGLTAFLFPFWTREILILEALILLAFYLRQFLTGTHTADFLILVLGTTFIFYGLLYVLKLTERGWSFVFFEAVYNFVFGLPFWYFLRKKKYEKIGF